MGKFDDYVVVDKGYNRIMSDLHKFTREEGITIGIHEDKAKRDSEDGEAVETNNAYIGLVHEFGRGHNPERSFLRKPFDEHVGEITQKIANAAAAIMTGRLTPTGALNQIGLFGVSLSKEAIRKGIPPALQPQTVKRKGSSTPLIDTGQLINSIRHKVGNK